MIIALTAVAMLGLTIVIFRYLERTQPFFGGHRTETTVIHDDPDRQ